jgi:hypothetical protein
MEHRRSFEFLPQGANGAMEQAYSPMSAQLTRACWDAKGDQVVRPACMLGWEPGP